MIGAFRQSDDIACLRLGVDELAERIAVLRHVDRKRRAWTGRSAHRQGCLRCGARLPRGSTVRSELPRRASRVWRRWRARKRHERHSRRAVWSGSAGPRPDSTIRGCEPSGSACAPNTRQRRPPVSGAAAAKDCGKTERRLGGWARRRLSADGREQRHQRDQSRQNSPSRCQSASRSRRLAPMLRRAWRGS